MTEELVSVSVGPKPKNKLPTVLSEGDKSSALGSIKGKGELKSCMNCGGTNLSMPPINVDASVVAYRATQKYYCTDCGYEGAPIVFRDFSTFEKFYRSKRLKYNMGVDQQEADYLLSSSFADETRRKGPFVAAVASFLIPGLGQAYAGAKTKAWLFFSLAVLLYLLSFGLVIFSLLDFASYFSIAIVLVMVFSSIDAYITAGKLNKRLKDEP
jgi:hypothetical protein